MKQLAAIVTLLALGQTGGDGYVRTRVETGRLNDMNARCLYWRAGPITWNLSSPGTADLPDTEAFGAIRASFGRWQSVMASCGNISLTEGAQSTSRRIGYDPESSDNENLVIFRERDCDEVAPANDPCWANETCANRFDCWFYSRDVLALTTNTYDIKSGEIYDADIELNTANHEFTTNDVPCNRVSKTECPCPPGVECVQTDVENTMTHEIGHFVGLAHTGDPASTMFATAPLGETQKRELDPDSAEFICDAYPAGFPPKNCVLQPASSELGQTPGGCSGGGGPTVLALAALALTSLARRRRSG